MEIVNVLAYGSCHVYYTFSIAIYSKKPLASAGKLEIC